MLKKKFRNLSLFLFFSIANIVLFQNCSGSGFEANRFSSTLRELASNEPVPSQETPAEEGTTPTQNPTDNNPTMNPVPPEEEAEEVPSPENMPTTPTSENKTMDNISADGRLDARGLLAFPGAQGAAKNASGGRGGMVVKVTTRADNCTPGDGQITWREALQGCGDVSPQKRTIVFDIGGTFHADHNQGHWQMGSGDITIACQTAPSPVVFTETVHNFSGHKNYIVRHCLHRIDGSPILGSGTDRGWNNTSGAGNAIFDHISVSWTQDSNWIVYQAAGEPSPKNFTLQYSNLSRGDGSQETTPGTNDSAVGPVCLGNDASSRIENCSFIGNFAAHNNTRNNGLWTASGEVFDNVVYNWWDGSIQAIDIMGKGNTSGFWSNNLVKPGPANPNATPFNNSGAKITGENNWLVSFNLNVESATLRDVNQGTPDHAQIARPNSDIRQLISSIENPFVRCNGASAWGMDPYDRKYWQDFYDNTGPDNVGYAKINRDYSVYVTKKWPETYDTDNDGIADQWEILKGGSLDKINSTSDLDSDGYTDLEEFINERARCPHIEGF